MFNSQNNTSIMFGEVKTGKTSVMQDLRFRELKTSDLTYEDSLLDAILVWKISWDIFQWENK